MLQVLERPHAASLAFVLVCRDPKVLTCLEVVQHVECRTGTHGVTDLALRTRGEQRPRSVF